MARAGEWVGMICALGGGCKNQGKITIDWHNFLNMPLNEKGDFFAGIFGPVTFLCVVIDYFQQREELQLNTDALKSQQVERWRQAGDLYQHDHSWLRYS